GGNAIDAVVAAAAAVTVVEPYSSSAAGGGVLLLCRPEDPPLVLDFLPRAPRAATTAVPRDQRLVGGFAVAVPGVVAGWSKLVAEFGSKSLGELLEPAIALAENGFPLTRYDRTMYEVWGKRLLPESRGNYGLGPEGEPPALGTMIVQRDLAS